MEDGCQQATASRREWTGDLAGAAKLRLHLAVDHTLTSTYPQAVSPVPTRHARPASKIDSCWDSLVERNMGGDSHLFMILVAALLEFSVHGRALLPLL